MSAYTSDPALAASLADLALTTAREAAALVRDRAAAGVSVASTKTSDSDPVTEIDRAAEALIRDRLLTARPHDAVLGEEQDDHPGTSGVRWIVDPVDGTVNLLYGLPVYSVSIAAELTSPGEEPAALSKVVAGVVLNIATGEEYVARPAPGADGVIGAYRDSRPLAVRGPAVLGQRLIGTGFSYDASLRAQQGAALARLLPRVRDVRRLGSCALDLCLVAQGSLDGYLEEGTHPWDHAAGALIARAAGAEVRTTTGVGGRLLLVCGPAHGFDELWTAVHEAGFTAEPPVESAGDPAGE